MPVPPTDPLTMHSFGEGLHDVPAAGNDSAPATPAPADQLPIRHTGRRDAADHRRLSWRRRPAIRTASFRHRRPAAELRP